MKDEKDKGRSFTHFFIYSLDSNSSKDTKKVDIEIDSAITKDTHIKLIIHPKSGLNKFTSFEDVQTNSDAKEMI